MQFLSAAGIPAARCRERSAGNEIDVLGFLIDGYVTREPVRTDAVQDGELIWQILAFFLFTLRFILSHTREFQRPAGRGAEWFRRVLPNREQADPCARRPASDSAR